MPENIPPKPKVILEIGPGPRPFPAIGLRRIGPNEMYIGLEKENARYANVLNMAYKELEAHQSSHAGSLTLMGGDGGKIPLRDNTVQEVVLANVFGLGERIKWDSLTAEIARVTDNGGRVIIVETISPSQALINELRRLFRKAGFFKARDPDFSGEDLIDQYNAVWREQEAYGQGSPYALVLKKEKSRVHKILNSILRR